jgi:hypothetical protein
MMLSNAGNHATTCPALNRIDPKEMNTNFYSDSNDQAHPQGAPPTFATIRPFKRWLAAGALGLLLIGGNLTQAQTTAVSDLGTTTDASIYAIIYSSSIDNQSYAQSFTTGADPVTLASVTLQIYNRADLYVDGGGFTVSLYSDNAGVPGALLAVLAGNDTPNVDGPYTYTAPPVTRLAATTTYWIWASVSPPPPYRGYSWAVASDLSETALPGWSLGACGSLSLHNGAGSWELYPAARLKMSVDIMEKTPADQIENLITLVNSLGIHSNVKRALVKDLNDALKTPDNACEGLSDFIEQVRKASHNKLTIVEAGLLIGDATDIQVALGCRNSADSQKGVGEQGDQERPHDSDHKGK